MVSATLGTIRAISAGKRTGTNGRLPGCRPMTETSAKPLFWLDKKAKQLFKPYMKSAPVKVLDKAGEVGDQLQMRVLCAGLVAVGVLRARPRMVRAGVRMLLAHELATYVKGMGKERIDRRRPRSTDGRKASKPHKGDSTEKEEQSFPSGHSAGAVAAACAFASVYPEYRAALAAGGAVALAQIPTCAHYPSDVAAGATIGAASNGALGLVGKALKTMAVAALRW